MSPKTEGSAVIGGGRVDKWDDNNLSDILEYPFDFERYIEERLREIDDLDERRFAKTVLLDGLGKLIQCTERKYRELERRVYEEVETQDNQYETVMTVVCRDHYDPTNGTLFPVISMDLETENLAEQLCTEGKVYLGTIFLKADGEVNRRFRAAGPFAGTLLWKGEEQDAAFLTCPAGRYRNRMEQIYQVFQDNHILWETINTGFLDKFYDVYLDTWGYIGSTDLKPGEVSLKEATLKLGEFADAVRYDIIPLWNMEWISFDSADFMLPCISGIYYEHEFSLKDAEEKDGYLIQTNEEILEIRREKEKIVIKSQKETFEGWKALHIIQRKTVRSLDYHEPLLTNHKRDTFFRRYSENRSVQLMTKTDLFRRIMELDIREYIEVIGYEICDNGKEYPAAEGMNWFVKDELFPMESRKVLLLKFEEKKPECFLNDSMVRFVISQIQMEISEYRCIGVMA